MVRSAGPSIEWVAGLGTPRANIEKMKNEFVLLLEESPRVPSAAPSSAIKHLSRGKRGTGGRNNFGRITIRRRGGGHKRRMYVIDTNGTVGLHST